MDSTSVSLLRRLRQPDPDAAWKRFVDLYAPLIFHWGTNQGLPATDAADLVQEVMTVLVVRLPEFEYDPTRRFRGWLHTVTVNKARDLQRRNAARPAVGLDPTIHRVAAGGDVDLFAERDYHRFLVQRALELMKAQFDERNWRACWEYVVEGKKAVDVARELGMTVNMVYLAKSRVLSHLREELEGLLE